MKAFWGKLRNGIQKINTNRNLSLLSLLLLLVVIPSTIYIEQKQQEIRQRASENQATITVSLASVEAGQSINVAWTTTQPNTQPPTPSQNSGSGNAVVGVSPTSVARGGNITLEWRYKDGLSPQSTDYLEIFVAKDMQHVGSLYMSSNCGPNPGNLTVSEGSCIFNTQPLGPTTYTVKVMRNGNPLGSQASFTVSGENPSDNTASPRSGFLLIQKAYAQTTLTGGETLQLFSVSETPKPTGRQIYLNCTETAAGTPPPQAVTSGTCAYPIPVDIPPGNYVFHMYAADGVTLLGESPTITITTYEAATIPGRIIVFYGTDTQTQQSTQDTASNQATETIQSLSVNTQEIAPQTVLVTTRPGNEDTLMAAYRRLPNVEEVIPDYALSPHSTPNDPLFPQQKALETIKMPSAWDNGQGQGVKIAILDTGITNHPDLQDRMGLQKDFFGAGLTPTSPHGTGVSGVAAATYSNNLGIAGTAGKATILNAKVGAESISLANAIEAIKWATDNGAKVINMSFGGRIACFPPLQEAIDYAWAHGVILIASAGNNGEENSVQAPAGCNHVTTIGATNVAGTNKMSFSNFGGNVPIAAPGDNEMSTNIDGAYSAWGGTSIAAGYVSGIAALLFQKYPSASPDFIQQKLFSTAKPLAGFSKGLVDAAAALNDTATPAPSPTPTIVATACSPRPAVQVQATANGDGRQRITITAIANTNFTNDLKSITWTSLSNSTIEGIESAIQGSTIPFSTGTQSTTFFVKRTTPGQTATAAITITDACGEWKTFVGGGPNAF